ncbi:MAG: hypothetical protein M0R68_12060, partial [Bacteroidetes bacterium]|nr:hypothetical protein [Bacteroidota bacterium]
IEAALEKKDFKKLTEFLELADKYEVRKSIRFKAWLETGLYYQREGHHSDSVVALSVARVYQPANIKVLNGLFTSLNEFISEFRDRFSTEDLVAISEQVRSLLEYYNAEKLWNSPSIQQGRQIYRRINYLKIDSTSAVETPASHKVDRIVKALRENVTMDEVAADYARIMAPVFLELLAKDIDEGRKIKKKKSKKKKLQDPPEGQEKEKKK